eukprot:1160996-Pelagomonas_calceolata.AAC.2
MEVKSTLLTRCICESLRRTQGWLEAYVCGGSKYVEVKGIPTARCICVSETHAQVHVEVMCFLDTSAASPGAHDAV